MAQESYSWLLPNERIAGEERKFGDSRVWVTNQRLYADTTQGLLTRVTGTVSMPIENVAIESVKQSIPGLLILGAVVLIGSLVAMSQEENIPYWLYGTMAIGATLMVSYVFSRSAALVISSNDSKIVLKGNALNGFGPEAAQSLANQILTQADESRLRRHPFHSDGSVAAA